MSEDKQAVIYDDETRTMMGLANILAAADGVPAHYKGKPKDCFVAVQMAKALNIEPTLYMQNTQPVLGNIVWKSTAVIMFLNMSKRYEGGIRYESEYLQGKLVMRRVVMKDRATGQDVMGPPVSAIMVKEEGWDKDKKNQKTGDTIKSKWNTMPEIMYSYRAAVFFVRIYCPEVLMGHQMIDEIDDISRSNIPEGKVNIDYRDVQPLDNEESQLDIEDAINDKNGKKSGSPDNNEASHSQGSDES